MTGSRPPAAGSPRILFRADASTSIGTGHVMRCLTLGAELVGRGWTVSIAGHMPPGLVATCAAAGVTTTVLPDDLARADEPGWLAQAGLLDADVVLSDSYGIGMAWQQAMAGPGRRLAAIDDLASVPMAVDLVLNQNLGATPERYRGLLPPAASVLAGPTFALLRPEFAERRARMAARSGAVERVLVFLSGADEHDVTGRAAEAVLDSGLAADVVVGSAYPALDALEARLRGTERVRMHVNTPRMADLMAAADLAIGAPSSASWERCTLGLPTILVLLADNQVEVGGLLAELGAGVLAGWHHEVTSEGLAAAVEALRTDPEGVRAMGAAAAAITDGRGTGRVADALAALLANARQAQEATE